MWVHEYKNWPSFTWDLDRLASKLAAVRYNQGRLLGRMEGLGFDLKQEASISILTNDVVKSSAIEGEKLDSKEVRSSIVRRLGVNSAGFDFDLVPAGRDIEGVVEMMLDATQMFSKALTKERLFNWHAALFPTGRSGMHNITVGNWRTIDAGPMQVVSGPIGRERIHFEAPSADKINNEMKVFLEWFKMQNNIGPSPVEPILKAGIAHLWFVTVHPFEDGNGRIARAITDMILARADGISDRFYSLSSQIESERKDYYNQLEKQQRSSLEITDWLEWFLDCLARAVSNADQIIGKVLFKAQIWDKINNKSVNKKPVNNRQRLIINRMLEDDFKGYMNTSKYAKLAKCSNDTALRDILDLKAQGVFIQNPGRGRSTSYCLIKNLVPKR